MFICIYVRFARNFKQLLVEVFVMSGIIKVEVSVTTNALSHRAQFIFDKPCSYFAVRELDIALGNHALRAQPTDYSLIC